MGDVVKGSFRALLDPFLERMSFARFLGKTHGGKRDLYGVLGYPDDLEPSDYRFMAARGGIAKRCVVALPKAVWRGGGELFEDESPKVTTAFETAWQELNDRHRLWSTLQRVHILSSLTSYAVLLIGADGDLGAELPKGAPDKLLYVQPYGGGVVSNGWDNKNNAQTKAFNAGADVTIREWDEDPRSPRFGKPLLYQLARPGNMSARVNEPVHWTRVIHVPAPDFLDDEIFGEPVLQAVWNLLLCLEKVTGGGSEAFWLRANAGIQFDVDRRMGRVVSSGQTSVTDGPPLSEKELEGLRAETEAYVHQMSRVLRTRGVNVNQLSSEVADFSNPQDAILTLIAGTLGIPKRILTGSEMGQLASEQDRDNWRDVVNDCRTSYADPIILSPFVNRLIEYGYLPTPAQWEADWPDVAAMNENQKLEAAVKASELNDHGEVVILGEEIREKYLGLEPLTPEQKETARPTPEPLVEENVDEDDEDIDRLEAAIRASKSVELVIKK